MPVNCEICGDECLDDESPAECESCSYKMCSACEFDLGLCRDCAEEQGLLDNDSNPGVVEQGGDMAEEHDDEDGGWMTHKDDSDDLWDSADDSDDDEEDEDDEDDEAGDSSSEGDDPIDEDDAN